MTSLPDEVATVVRRSGVALEIRTLVRHLGPWGLDVCLPRDVGRIPHSLLQLLKLALLPGEGMQLRSIEVLGDDDGASAVVSGHGGRVLLSSHDLAGEVRLLVHRLAREVARPSDLLRMGETLALELTREETVRKLSSRMLMAADLEEALYAMLLGITSGYGASFPRAALFTYDEASRTFHGSSAIGPRDEAEAHRIWEAIETEDKTLDQTLDDYKSRSDVGGYEVLVRTLALAETDGPELALALASGVPQIFREPPESATLARMLVPASEYVLSVIQPRGPNERLGMIVADNAYGGKPIVPAQIEFLRALVAPTSLVWDTRSLLRRVDSLARHDPLTGLYNRRELEERLLVEQSRCVRVQRPVSIAMIDLDHFKEVNDAHGHAAGDVVLRRVGELLRQTLRQHDVPARYGGDEFVLMLPEGTKEELIAVTTRIGELASAQGISMSVGGATWPADATDPVMLLELADAQLYAAKGLGRGCLCVPGHDVVRFSR